MQILRAKKFKMKTSMSKKKRLGSELERKEAMEKYLEVKFAEEELQKELDDAKSRPRHKPGPCLRASTKNFDFVMVL